MKLPLSLSLDACPRCFPHVQCGQKDHAVTAAFGCRRYRQPTQRRLPHSRLLTFDAGSAKGKVVHKLLADPPQLNILPTLKWHSAPPLFRVNLVIIIPHLAVPDQSVLEEEAAPVKSALSFATTGLVAVGAAKATRLLSKVK